MKKIIVVCVVLLGVVLSGCGKTTSESTNTSTQSSEQNTKTTEKTSQSSEQNTKPAAKASSSQSPTSSEVPQVSDHISGVWLATGKQDGVSSTWYFNNTNGGINKSAWHYRIMSRRRYRQIMGSARHLLTTTNHNIGSS